MVFLGWLFQAPKHPTGAPSNDPLPQVKQLNELAEKCYSRYTRTGLLAELDKCIELYRQALECTPRPCLNLRAGLLNNMSCRLHDRYDRTKTMADLDEACRSLQFATEVNHSDRGAFLSNLGAYLGERFEQTGQTKDLEQAVQASRQAVECTPEAHPEWPTFLGNLGNQLGQRYSQIGNIADLEESVQILRLAYQSAPTTHAHRPAIISNLALQLGERYISTGTGAELDEAIILARQAFDDTHKSDPKQAQRLGTLSTLLYYRFNRAGGISDLDEAIQKQREVVRATPMNQSGRAGYLSNLASILYARSSRSGALSDITEAIELAREAVNETPESYVYKAAMLNTLGLLFGAKAAQTRDKADLDEAIRVTRQVLQLLPHDRPERVRSLHNLAMLLGSRYSQTKTANTVDLDETVKVAQQAVDAAPSDYPDLASLLNNLGIYLAESYSQTGISTSLEKAKECFISAVYHQSSPVQNRVTAGRLFLLLPDILEDLDQAYEIARFTVDLVPLLILRSHRHEDRQALLQQAVAIASDAAAIAMLHNKGAAHAVELLEIGRNVISNSLQDLRTDLFKLQEKHPDLASRFDQLRQQLDVPVAQDNIATSGTPKSLLLAADRRREAEGQLETALNDIRMRPGFEDFLQAPSAASIQAAAEDGPVVIINVSRYRCDALIIQVSGLRAVPLPAISWDTIHRHDRGSLETLEWLWDDIVLPVFDALGFTQKPSDGHWPRVWWIPTGRLVGFPLHAAGYHLRQRPESTLDRVVSSYSGSVKTIIHSRRQQGHEAREMHVNQDVVLVSMETTPKLGPLSHSANEIQAIREVVDSSNTLSSVEPSPLKKDVLLALSSCSIFHFAGHGGTDLRNPLQSLLYLSDWQDSPLTVESVFETNLGREMPFLAYLSACGTSEIQVAGLVDEAIHMTTAFQLSGFQHVIGTLWSVDDRLCVDMARMIYEGLLMGGMRDEAVSRSLHRATRELRSQWVKAETAKDSRDRYKRMRDIIAVEDTSEIRPLWVPYVHYGV
ncbi:hypothetical protein FZEAL_3495 [Fusarium zealandicum]|uniref:CHAT domain-containing protein n=1 Tax=Fusarium zealandicum TaxID=1053134 RepID=A0A8H4UNJ5_9HYPO|nr:hypothetical protein FZEAL_3495 [Fusarium zealandicum]